MHFALLPSTTSIMNRRNQCVNYMRGMLVEMVVERAYQSGVQQREAIGLGVKIARIQ
jgi:hypothetical protein